MACDHLDLINPANKGKDGTFVFVLIHDREHRRVRHIRKRFEDALPELIQAQSEGYGVFVIPHDATGPKIPQIRRARCLVVDFDDRAAFRRFRRTPLDWLRPSMVIQTQRGFHVYFECDPSDPLWEDAETVRHMPGRLASLLGSDQAATSLSQPFRLAGFLHLKGKPVLVTIQSLNFASFHTARDLLGQFPPPEAVSLPSSLDASIRGEPYPFPILRLILRESAAKIRTARPGARFNMLRKAAFRLGCYVAHGMNHDLAWTSILNAARSHKDPGLLRQVRTDIWKVFLEGIARGRDDPPTPPPSVGRKGRLHQWARDVAERVRGNAVVLSRLVAYNRGWKAFGTHRQASQALGSALRARGFRPRYRKSGRRAQLAFFRDSHKGEA